MKIPRIKVGDMVRPKPEWINDPCKVPSGRVEHIEKFGDNGAIYVEGDRRGLSGYVFEVVR